MEKRQRQIIIALIVINLVGVAIVGSDNSRFSVGGGIGGTGEKVNVKSVGLAPSKNYRSGSILLGDANGDGVVDVNDAIAILDYMLSGTPVACYSCADYNQDGRITMEDYEAVVGLLSPVVSSVGPGGAIPSCVGSYVLGDVNGDGELDISDLSYFLLYQFVFGSAPVCFEVADVNLDGIIDLSDIASLAELLLYGVTPYGSAAGLSHAGSGPNPVVLDAPASGSILLGDFVARARVSGVPDLEKAEFVWDGQGYEIYNDNLVLMYNFDKVGTIGETYTHIVDLSASENDLDLFQGVFGGLIYDYDGDEYTEGRYGLALRMNRGVPKMSAGPGRRGERFISESDVPITGNDPRTIAFWVRLDNVPPEGTPSFISFGTDGSPGSQRPLSISVDDGQMGKIEVRAYNGSGAGFSCTWEMTQPDNYLDLDIWTHLAVTYDGSNVVLYKDGRIVPIKSFGNGCPNFDTSLGPFLVWGNIGSQWKFEYSIDEVRVWDRVLNKEEVKKLYKSNLKKDDDDEWEIEIDEDYEDHPDEDDDDHQEVHSYGFEYEDDNGDSSRSEGRWFVFED